MRQCAPNFNINLLLLPSFQGEIKPQRLTLASSSPSPKFLFPVKVQIHYSSRFVLTVCCCVGCTAPSGQESLPGLASPVLGVWQNVQACRQIWGTVMPGPRGAPRGGAHVSCPAVAPRAVSARSSSWSWPRRGAQLGAQSLSLRIHLGELPGERSGPTLPVFHDCGKNPLCPIGRESVSRERGRARE